jgi:hypothetical protein
VITKRKIPWKNSWGLPHFRMRVTITLKTIPDTFSLDLFLPGAFFPPNTILYSFIHLYLSPCLPTEASSVGGRERTQSLPRMSDFIAIPYDTGIGTRYGVRVMVFPSFAKRD